MKNSSLNMKYQGIIIALIISGALILSVFVHNNQKQRELEAILNSQKQRDIEMQNAEIQRGEKMRECISAGTESVERDACSYYGLSYPCTVPNAGRTGVNTGIKYVLDYCDKNIK